MDTLRRTPLDPTEELLAIAEIQRLFAARLHCMDTRQWDRYASFHTSDVISETWDDLAADRAPGTEEAPRRVVGNEVLARAIEQALDGPVRMTTVHHGHTPEIEVTSPTTARGVWAMEDLLWWSDQDGERHLHGWGHYHEEYRKEQGRWLISRRRLTRLRVEASPDFFRLPTGRNM